MLTKNTLQTNVKTLKTFFSQVFTEYEKLLHSENYVTKRQSLKVIVQQQFPKLLHVLLKIMEQLLVLCCF